MPLPNLKRIGETVPVGETEAALWGVVDIIMEESDEECDDEACPVVVT